MDSKLARHHYGNPTAIAHRKAKLEQRHRDVLAEAIDNAVVKQGKRHLIEEAVLQAYSDTTLMCKLLDKLLPNLKAVEVKVDKKSPFKLIMDFTPKQLSEPENTALPGPATKPIDSVTLKRPGRKKREKRDVTRSA